MTPHGTHKIYDPLNESPINRFGSSMVFVHQYVGGIEHAVLHMYARFFVKALHSIGELNFKEPFKELFCQGWFVIKHIKLRQ